MGKKSAPSPPKPPDPVKTIQAQSEANKEALTESMRLNAIDIYGPAGYTTYGRRADGTPHSQYTKLSPEQQYLYDRQMQVGANLGDLALGRTNQIPTNQFSLSGLPYDPNTYNLNSVLSTFSPVSFPRDMSQVGGAYGYGGGSYGGGKSAPQAPPGGYAGGGFGGTTPTPPPEQVPDYSQQKMQYDQAGRDVQLAAQRAYQDYDRQVNDARNEWAGQKGESTVKDFFNRFYRGFEGGEQYDSGGEANNIETRPIVNKYEFDYKTPGDYSNLTITRPESSKGGRTRGPQTYTFDQINEMAMKGQAIGDNWIVNYNRDPSQFDASGVNFSAGAAPEGFDANYYRNAMSLGEGTDAWSHYVQNNLGKDNYRAGFSPTAPDPAPGPTAASGAPLLPGEGPALPPGGAQQGGKGGISGAPPPPGYRMPPPGGGATYDAQGNVAPPTGAPTDGQLPLNWPTSNQNFLPYDPRSYGNVDMFAENVQDAVYDQQMRNLQPTFDRQYDKQKQDLANRGIPVGSEAWKSATEELNRNQQNAYQQAVNQSIAAGGAEASRLMGMEQQLRGTAFNEATTLNQLQNAQNMDRINLEQNLRQRALQERLLERTQAFNEASALLQGSPALTMPNAPAIPTYNLQAPDVIGAHNAAFQNQMAAYNAQAQASAGAWQGAGQMVSGLASIATKCARKYKEDFGKPERILDRMSEIEVGTWRYKREIEPNQPLHISPFAEDVHEAFGLGDGDTLPLIDLIGVCWRSIQELNDEVKRLKAENARLRK